MIFRNHSIPIQKKISLGGILAALIVISLLAAAWIPTNKLFFLAVSSLFSSIMVTKVDLANALLLYGSTSILAFFVVPSKAIFVAYILFFGIYGIVKFLCERIHLSVLRWALKLLFFNIALGISYLLINTVFIGEFAAKLPIQLLWGLMQVVFIIYDFMYTLFISYYYEKLDKRIWHL